MAFSLLPSSFDTVKAYLIGKIGDNYPKLGAFLQNSFLIIFVDVVTPNGRRPIQSALVQVTALYDNKVETIELPLTDGLGHTQGELVLPGVTPGQKVQTIVNAFAPGDEFIGSTSLTYTIWW